MADGFGVIRSYQRIFRPDRRVYQIDNHRLPVPGGVPLRWLGYAVATLVAVIVLSTRGEGVLILSALAAAGYGFVVGGRVGAVVAAAGALVVTFVLGFVLAALDWPLRLIVVPAMVATLATQATPDGRPAHRYLASWVALRLRPTRRSLGRALPVAGSWTASGARLWVAADERRPWLAPGRVSGPATVRFAAAMVVRRRLWPRGARSARPLRDGRRGGRRVVVVDTLALAERERLWVRR